MCAGNVTWRSVQCCTCSNWIYLRGTLVSFCSFKTLCCSHSWSYVPAFRGGPTPANTVFSFSDFSSLYISIVQPGPYLFNLVQPLLLMQHFRTTLAYKPPTHFPPTSHLLPLHCPHPFIFLAVFLYPLLPLSRSQEH